MGKIESVNEIISDISLKRNINEKKSLTSDKVNYTDYIADKLVKIYNAPNSRKFFCKCAWHLSEDIIWSAVEDSRKRSVKEPVKLFVFLCNKALRERPINN